VVSATGFGEGAKKRKALEEGRGCAGGQHLGRGVELHGAAPQRDHGCVERRSRAAVALQEATVLDSFSLCIANPPPGGGGYGLGIPLAPRIGLFTTTMKMMRGNEPRLSAGGGDWYVLI